MVAKIRYFALGLLAFSAPAFADSFYTLVGYQCDSKANRIVITYKGAYNEDGEALVRNKGPDEWEPGSLIKSMKDDDHIGELETVRRQCRLSDGVYSVSIGPSPGNMNIQGRCGAQISAWAEIARGSVVLLPRSYFEGDCHDTSTPITTRIVVKPGGAKPELTETPYNDFYR